MLPKTDKDYILPNNWPEKTSGTPLKHEIFFCGGIKERTYMPQIISQTESRNPIGWRK